MNNTEKKATQAQQEENDNKITHTLAALMLAMHECGKIKSEDGVTKTYVKAVILIEKNPGWVIRFRKKIKEMNAQIQLQASVTGLSIVPTPEAETSPPESLL